MPWWKFWEGKRDRGDGPDYYEEGVALARQARYHEALTSFRLALRQRPDDAAVLEQMAVVYTQIGVTDEALRLYRRALSLRDSPAAHYGVGFLLLRRGEDEEAARHLRAFLEGAPSGSEAAEHVRHAQRTLERLEGQEAGGEEAGREARRPPPAPGPGGVHDGNG